MFLAYLLVNENPLLEAESLQAHKEEDMYVKKITTLDLSR